MMDVDTAFAIMSVLDEAEGLLGQIRFHDGPICQETLHRQRELLDEARRRLELVQTAD